MPDGTSIQITSVSDAAAAKNADGTETGIIDDTKIAPVDEHGNPIPVTIPIALAPGISVVYTTRLGGVSTGDYGNFNLGGKGGDDPDAIRRNREALANEIGAKLSLICQVHSGEAVDVDDVFTENRAFGFDASGTVARPDRPVVPPLPEVPTVSTPVGELPADEVTPGDNPGIPVDDGTVSTTVDDVEDVAGDDVQIIEGDAQVTTRSGIALGMFAADCLPVLLADPEAGVIGAAHCGRLGLQKGVIRAAVAMMIEKGARPERIVATLGPAICGDCYEVGQDIADAFDQQFDGTYTLTRFGGAGIDINRAAIEELAAAGITADRIVSSQPRVLAATQYLAQDPELQQLCKDDNEGDPALDERLANIRHSMCTLENPLWFSHRRAQLAHKAHEGRMLALIVKQ
nr:polyphenol oxidase family protein [Bifidobacterium choloepi]